MARPLEQIEKEVLELPEESRARLVARLLATFRAHPGSDEESIAMAWVDEAERRDDEMSDGGQEGIPAEKVLSKLRKSLQ
jgi:hypothetical protein